MLANKIIKKPSWQIRMHQLVKAMTVMEKHQPVWQVSS